MPHQMHVKGSDVNTQNLEIVLLNLNECFDLCYTYI